MPGTTAPAPEPPPAPRRPSLSLPEPVAVRSSDETLSVELSDGRTIIAPLVWYPRLTHATAEERAVVELTPFGIHWPLLDEDVSVEMLLEGTPSSEHPSSLRAWIERMARRRAQIAGGEAPEPHYPTLPLPAWWDEADATPAPSGS